MRFPQSLIGLAEDIPEGNEREIEPRRWTDISEGALSVRRLGMEVY